jgi:hypothetical protein
LFAFSLAAQSARIAAVALPGVTSGVERAVAHASGPARLVQPVPAARAQTTADMPPST